MLRTFVRFAAPLLATAAVTACVDGGQEIEDDEADVALGGKGDGALEITPAEHALMMHTALWAEKATLRNEVGLTRRAVDAIDRARLGPDGSRNTGRDNTYFRTIEDLDAVPYVGKVSLEKLRDYVRTLEDFPANASERWHVRGGTLTTTAPPSSRWSDQPTFGLDRGGALLALYMASETELVFERDGERIAVPHLEGLYPYQYEKLHLAVDEANTVHVFFAIREDYKPRFRHLTYANDAWTQQPVIEADKLQVAEGPHGEVYALASGSRYVVELIRFHADGTSTVEDLAGVTSGVQRALAVAADGTPIIAWTTTEFLTRPGGFSYRRVTPAGPVVTSATLSLGAWFGGNRIFVSAADTPTVVIAPHWGPPYIARDTGNGFVEVTPEDLTAGVGKFSGATHDASGMTSGCAIESGYYDVVEGTIDADGHAELRKLIHDTTGVSFCVVRTDAAGQAHLVYGNRLAYIHATAD